MDYVVAKIRSGILNGEFPLGSHLDQNAVATRLGVSIIPVREALRRLEADGLVSIVPRHGVFVAEISAHELREVSKILEVLEGLAATLALPQIGDLALRHLEDLNARMLQAASAAELDKWIDTNRDWHMTLVEESRSPLLIQIVATLWNRTTLFRQVYSMSPEHRMQSVAEHERILEACRAHDVKALTRALRDHFRGSTQELLRDVTHVDSA